MRVRPYELSDFAVIAALGKDMHAESPDFRGFSYDPHAVLSFSDLVLGTDTMLCVVAENQHGIAGFFVGGVGPFFFGPDLYCFDICFYVRPECRGSSAAVRLVNYFMAWAKAKGAKQARLGAATGINPQQADKFFKGLGFAEGGVLYTSVL